MKTTTAGSEGLKRELGVLDIATSVLNITVGSGIFLLPALVAAILGNASILAYIFCGLLYFCIMLCYAEMSGCITNSGGGYVYIEKAFGPFTGFIANNLFWFSGVSICAALCTVLQICFRFPSLFSINNFIALFSKKPVAAPGIITEVNS